MNRFLICTAMGLFLGVTPALAQDQAPQDETMSPPAIQSPDSPSEVPSLIDKSMSPSTEAPSPNETIGDINDLVTDKSGKIVAVLVRAGSFLGIGGKDVAVPFEDLNIARDADNNLTVLLNIDQNTIASAPDYQRLDEQQVVEGANKTDREDSSRTY
jgi:hypothetical protein